MLHILLMFALYALYVLLPIVPTVVIYRLFPDTSVTVSGPLAKLTINASGAFAAYIVTVALGYNLVTKTDAMIAGLSSPTWEVNMKVELKDNDGKPLQNAGMLVKNLKILLDPPLEQRGYPQVKVRLPLLKPDHWPMLVIHVPEFQEAPIDLASELREQTAVLDVLKGSITLKRTLVLEQLPRAALETPYSH
jgi:hypothetical protein